MKASSIVMIWVVVASLICGETLRAAPKLGSNGKSIVTKVANTVGMRRLSELRGKLMANFFVKPANSDYSPARKAALLSTPQGKKDGGYSTAHKAVAIAALASTCWWGTMTGCYYTKVATEEEAKDALWSATGLVVVGIFVIGVAVAVGQLTGHVPTPHFPNSSGIGQHRLGRGNLFNHSMEVDNETYRGVLITYRDGVDTRTGLAFSPQASLAFTLQDSEQGALGFVAKDDSFQVPEEITVKHPDGETPDTVISLSQVENVLLTEEPILQELPLGE